MGSLIETIKDDSQRRAVVDDCVVLIDAEVADKKGLSGGVVRAMFKTVKSFKPGIVPMSMDALLDDFAAKVQPYWEECQSSGSPTRSYFNQHQENIAQALLEITDERAAKSKHKTLVSAYKKLRPKAMTHIGQAMPRLADLMEKHAG